MQYIPTSFVQKCLNLFWTLKNIILLTNNRMHLLWRDNRTYRLTSWSILDCPRQKQEGLGIVELYMLFIPHIFHIDVYVYMCSKYLQHSSSSMPLLREKSLYRKELSSILKWCALRLYEMYYLIPLKLDLITNITKKIYDKQIPRSWYFIFLYCFHESIAYILRINVSRRLWTF